MPNLLYLHFLWRRFGKKSEKMEQVASIINKFWFRINSDSAGEMVFLINATIHKISVGPNKEKRRVFPLQGYCQPFILHNRILISFSFYRKTWIQNPSENDTYFIFISYLLCHKAYFCKVSLCKSKVGHRMHTKISGGYKALILWRYRERKCGRMWRRRIAYTHKSWFVFIQWLLSAAG